MKTTKNEAAKFAPICQQFGRHPEDARLLIALGRKIGFLLDFGSITSKHCFHNEAPTNSLKKKDGGNTGRITLIPNGWKVAIEVKSTLYLGEVSYLKDSIVPYYRFSRLDGGTIVDSSEYFDAPTPAFVQISFRNPDTSIVQDERPNGKLYMAVQYSEPQNVLRRHFAQQQLQFPDSEMQSKYEQWLRDPNADMDQSYFPPPLSPVINKPPPQTRLPAHRTSSSSVEAPRMVRKRSSDVVNTFKNMNITSSSSSSSSSNTSNSATKRMVVISEAVDEAHRRIKTPDPIFRDTFRPPLERNNSEGVSDDLYSDFFQSTVLTVKNLKIRNAMKLLRGDSLEILLEEDIFQALDKKLAGNMSAEELFMALKRPQDETLSRHEIHRAMSTLLQMPIPAEFVNLTFRACDRHGNGKITLQNFVSAIEMRENELAKQFRMIDKDNSGEITLEELRDAKRHGLFNAQEREIDALLTAMDRVSVISEDFVHGHDRKIQWSEFRALMILLPPATTIQAIVDIVKDTLHEEDVLKEVDRSLLVVSREAATVPSYKLSNNNNNNNNHHHQTFQEYKMPAREQQPDLRTLAERIQLVHEDPPFEKNFRYGSNNNHHHQPLPPPQLLSKSTSLILQEQYDPVDDLGDDMLGLNDD